LLRAAFRGRFYIGAIKHYEGAIKMNNENKSEKVYMALPLDELTVANYQRSLSPIRVNKMNKAFDVKALGVLVVSDRDSKFYLIDGHHRVELMKANGIKEWYCEIYTGLTYEQEAALYHLLDTGQKQLTPLERFKALLEAKDADALKIQRVLLGEGFGINFGGEGNNRKLVAIRAVQTIYADVGANGLREILQFIDETWNGNREALQDIILYGLRRFFKERRGDFDKNTLVKKMAAIPIANAIMHSKKYLGSREIAFAQTIVDIYNSGKRTKKIKPIN